MSAAAGQGGKILLQPLVQRYPDFLAGLFLHDVNAITFEIDVRPTHIAAIALALAGVARQETS
jgi:hypothetical protein